MIIWRRKWRSKRNRQVAHQRARIQMAVARHHGEKKNVRRRRKQITRILTRASHSSLFGSSVFSRGIAIICRKRVARRA